MSPDLDHTNLHRTAKYFMDTGTASTHEEAVSLLHTFGLTIYVGDEVRKSESHQSALLTLINVARRTLLGGVEIVGCLHGLCISRLAPGCLLSIAAEELGARLVAVPNDTWPAAMIGTANVECRSPMCLQLTWQGWCGGIAPSVDGLRLKEDSSMAIAPVLAASVCAAEVFSYFAKDDPFVGRRPIGLSLWDPRLNWVSAAEEGPEINFLPSKLWVIGLGNLGQAYAWLLGCLPFAEPDAVELLLQDFDQIAPSNESTSILSFASDVGRRKVRCVAAWLEARGLPTVLEERRFGEHTRRASNEPTVALCGVDNALARMALGSVGFELVIEAGLGAGPHAFRSISMHTFPASRSPQEVWARQTKVSTDNFQDRPAYQSLKTNGIDACGLTLLASRTVGVPFVGLVAACLVISELLRRLNGGTNFEQISGSVCTLGDLETTTAQSRVYPGAFQKVANSPIASTMPLIVTTERSHDSAGQRILLAEDALISAFPATSTAVDTKSSE